MIPLPVIENCNDCGACCREQCSPPGYVAILLRGSEFWPIASDVARFNALPADALESLKRYAD